MKYLLAGLAVVAAVAALFFRPPLGALAPSAPVEQGFGAPLVVGGRLESSASPSAAGGSRGKLGAPAKQGGSIGASTGGLSRVVVYVAGEVVKPGVYTLGADQRAQDALARAGGPKPDADSVAVNLAAPLTDGEEIAVPKIGAETAHHRGSTSSRSRASPRPRRHSHRRTAAAGSSDSVEAPAQNIDLNSADETELETLPGIGPALAARIVAYREANGPFTSVDELADISGISPGLQDKLADYLVVR